MRQKHSQIMIERRDGLYGLNKAIMSEVGDSVNMQEVEKRIREEFGEDFWYYWNLEKDNDVDDWY